MKLVDRERIQKALRESVIALCQTSVDYDAELIVEGLLGITLDKKEIILVKINEVIKQDGPKDLSIPKRSSEKRKADADFLNNNDPPSLVLHYPSKKSKPSVRNHLGPNFANQCNDVSQREDALGSGLPSSSGTLRMPIIPPEYVQSQFHRQDRHTEINSMAEKHTEISKILGGMNFPVLNIVPQQPEVDERCVNLSKIKSEQKSATTTYMPAYEGVDEGDNLVILDDVGQKAGMSGAPKLHVNSDKAQGYLPSYMKSSNPWVSTSTKSPTSSTYTSKSGIPKTSTTNHTVGVALDTNVQPPAAPAVVSGSGMLHSIEQKNEDKVTQSGPNDPSPSGGHTFSQKAHKEEALSPEEAGGKTPTSGGRGSKEFRRFRCTMCPASSSRKFNLQRHMKSHHPGFNDCFIIDLTPKERGHSKAGEVSYTPKLVSSRNEESNDSSQAMDLSSAGIDSTGIDSAGIDYWYGTAAEEKASPTGSLGKSNMARSSADMCPQSKESVASVSSNSDSVSKKVTERIGKSSKDGGSSKIRKGLDQMLFSKFGFYTKVTNDIDGSNGSSKLPEKEDQAGDNGSVFPGLVPLPSSVHQDDDSTDEESKGSDGNGIPVKETLPFSIMDDQIEDIESELSPKNTDIAEERTEQSEELVPTSQLDDNDDYLGRKEVHVSDAVIGYSFLLKSKSGNVEKVIDSVDKSQVRTKEGDKLNGQNTEHNHENIHHDDGKEMIKSPQKMSSERNKDNDVDSIPDAAEGGKFSQGLLKGDSINVSDNNDIKTAIPEISKGQNIDLTMDNAFNDIKAQAKDHDEDMIVMQTEPITGTGLIESEKLFLSDHQSSGMNLGENKEFSQGLLKEHSRNVSDEDDIKTAVPEICKGQNIDLIMDNDIQAQAKDNDDNMMVMQTEPMTEAGGMSLGENKESEGLVEKQSENTSNREFNLDQNDAVQQKKIENECHEYLEDDLPEENAYFVDGFTELSDASSGKNEMNAIDNLEDTATDFLLDEGDTDGEVGDAGVDADNEDDAITDLNHVMSINDENANEDTLCKLKVLRSVRKKSTEVSQKTRISPRDSMKLRTRTLSGSGGKTS